MKNLYKLLAIIAIVAVIGFSFTACDDSNDDGGDIDYTVWFKNSGAAGPIIYFDFEESISGLTIDDIIITEDLPAGLEHWSIGSVEKINLLSSDYSWVLSIHIIKEGMISVKINKSGINSETKTVYISKTG
jgi:hypothetical protein